jgi:hypothetical protein
MLWPVAVATWAFVSRAQAFAAAPVNVPVPTIDVGGALVLLPRLEQAASRRTQSAPAAASFSGAWVPEERNDPPSGHACAYGAQAATPC